ncbi:MAG: hypothetical protein O9302_08775 [Cyclobacteriaceae bacterium]|jgi:hypothetical protein|nr:hypothetical protein [Cytophagales bacterium]MCZ8328138.1 hypothetical protein [Cyclobacteriaceae bacterium]
MEITLFQTLEDRENPDVIERDGPFQCRFKTAWLGLGYYFWDTHIQLGHWWGRLNYPSGYVICRSSAILDDTCWDLHGNGRHREEFEKTCEELISKKLSTRDSLLVPQVITYLANSKRFPFRAIRALGMESISHNLTDNFVVFRIKFKYDKKSFLDLRPPVQLCLLDRKALTLKDYVIVYPDHYVDFDYA